MELRGCGRMAVAVGAVVVIAAGAVHAQQTDRARDRRVFMFGGSRLGVTVADVAQAEADRLKIQGGAVIEDVRPNSPAEKAGLTKSDVVVEYDGERVRSARQFSRLVEETPSGRMVRVAVMRDGRKRDMQATPSDERSGGVYFDGPEFRAQIEQLTRDLPRFQVDLDGNRSRTRLGVVVDDLTPQLAEYFGAKDGVLVSSVSENSAAARAGLKAGDVITSVNDVPVRSRADLVRELRTREGETTLGIVRDKKATTVKATLDATQPARRQIRSGRPA